MTTTILVKAKAGSGDRRSRAVIPIKIRARPATVALRSSRVPVPPVTGHCPVCFRAACPLKSHEQYARSRGLDQSKTVARERKSSSGLSAPSTEGSLDNHGRIDHRLVGIGGAKVDSFIEFPLPKGVTAEVHQLFRDCKSAIESTIMPCRLTIM